jgi:hypothetical protein
MPINSFLYPGAKTTIAYEVANSLRFDSASNDYLNRSLSSGTGTTFTVSAWVKRSDNSKYVVLLSSGANSSNDLDEIVIQTDGTFRAFSYTSGYTFHLTSNAVFRDVSAWYHFMFVYDSTNSTSGDRARMYVNGSEITSFSAEVQPSQSTVSNYFNKNREHYISGNLGSTDTGTHYIAEYCFIDGQALTPTSFGEFDEDSPNIWKPKSVLGLNFGTNGFYLDFENASSLGADVSGNSNNFTVNNLTSADQSTDTCTNNFATINSLENYHTPHTLSEGNLKQTTANSSNYAPNISTIALTQGKWYFECKYVSRSSSDNYNLIGVKSTQITNTNYLGQNQHDYGYYSSSGKYYTNNSAVNYGDSYDQGDIIGVYLDLDNNKLYFAKNGTLQNSGTGISITDPASTPLGHYFFSVGDYGSSLVVVNDWNFGGTQSFSISSGNTDPNGYGNFEYDPSSGTFDGGSKSFYALNTKNLAEFG